MNLGSIFWLTPEGKIKHPYVVVESNPESSVVCAITTNAKKMHMPGNVVLEAGEGGLEKQSIVEVYKRFEVKNSELPELIGQIDQNRVKEIIAGIKFVDRIRGNFTLN